MVHQGLGSATHVGQDAVLGSKQLPVTPAQVPGLPMRHFPGRLCS